MLTCFFGVCICLFYCYVLFVCFVYFYVYKMVWDFSQFVVLLDLCWFDADYLLPV